MYILGINSVYHESSACLLHNGKIVAAVEEERFNRKKHAKSATIESVMDLPIQSIDYCLKLAGISFDQVDQVGYSFDPVTRYEKNVASDTYDTGDSWGSEEGEKRFLQLNQAVQELLEKHYQVNLNSRFHFISHHMCHLASAFFVSPYDKAAVLCVDGIGEFESTTLALGNDKRIDLLSSIDYPHSLGFLWEYFSKFLGFSEYDACKVMGLASYGDHTVYLNKFAHFLTYDNQGNFAIDPEIIKFRIDDFSPVEPVLGPHNSSKEYTQKHMDIAAALQYVTEEIILALSNKLHRETGSQNLCLAGGVALNCVANGKIIDKSPFTNVWVQPGANDAGTSIGAAFYLWNQTLGKERSFVMEHAYLGPSFTNDEIEEVLKKNYIVFEKENQVEAKTAQLLADGNVVGWFQGKMEFGPRALGNRSLLADPRNSRMKDTLNHKVKHREDFRPFCPSVLHDKSDTFFTGNDSPAKRYMLAAVEVISDKIPAVTHTDNTARVQEVHPDTNPRYYKLLQEFEYLTGVGVLLNTSFNDQEPIVCTPEDALKTFFKTNIDYLVIGDYIIPRSKNNRAF